MSAGGFPVPALVALHVKAVDDGRRLSPVTVYPLAVTTSQWRSNDLEARGWRGGSPHSSIPQGSSTVMSVSNGLLRRLIGPSGISCVRLWVGPIEPNERVFSTCGVRACVNFRHLEARPVALPTLPNDRFTREWIETEAGSWLLGLWTADGYLSLDASMSLTLKDHDAVHLAAVALGLNVDRVGSRGRSRRRMQPRTLELTLKLACRPTHSRRQALNSGTSVAHFRPRPKGKVYEKHNSCSPSQRCSSRRDWPAACSTSPQASARASGVSAVTVM
jgi:hypothetical protein